ncbi:MAG: Hsp20/alpha crystallin family protein [Bacteroidota bacterium]
MITTYEQKLPTVTLDAFRGDDFFGARLLDFESELFTMDWKQYMPSVDITADESFFYIQMPAGGFTTAEFSFECENGILFIAAERKTDRPGEDTLMFRRSFSLPDNAATVDISSVVSQDRLRVAIPKIS